MGWLPVKCDKLYHKNQDENVPDLYIFDQGFRGVEILKGV